jgi:hypothetical protein
MVVRQQDPQSAKDYDDRTTQAAKSVLVERLLRLRKLRCLHSSPLLSQPENLDRKLHLQTVRFSGGRAVQRRLR